MKMDSHAAAVGAKAKEAIETMKALIMKERYKDATECIKMAIELYPAENLLEEEKDGFGLLIISETLHYGDIYLSNCGDFDCYSVLHLPPSSTEVEVKKRFDELKKEIIHLKNTMKFDGAKLADSNLFRAKYTLCHKYLRSEFDRRREDCVFLDRPPRPPSSSSSSSSWRERYLDWKPPVYRVDATQHVKSWKELKLEHLFSHENQQEKEKDLLLSLEFSVLKRKVFDAMPQNPHYTPLEKFSKNIREGIILGLEVAFTKLSEEIRNLVDIDSFWHGLDGFNEQLSQFKEMGYNVEMVSQRIDILKRIAESEQVLRDEAKEFEDKVKDQNAKVINLESRISELQAEIEESKDVIANHEFQIETLKDNSSYDVDEFTSTAKCKWGCDSDYD